MYYVTVGTVLCSVGPDDVECGGVAYRVGNGAAHAWLVYF